MKFYACIATILLIHVSINTKGIISYYALNVIDKH